MIWLTETVRRVEFHVNAAGSVTEYLQIMVDGIEIMTDGTNQRLGLLAFPTFRQKK
jgi:hypothetical protein